MGAHLTADKRFELSGCVGESFLIASHVTDRHIHRPIGF